MQLRVYTRRFKRYDNYTVRRTPEGWHIDNIDPAAVDCDTHGRPVLFANLDHDSVNYPAALGDYLDFLWRQAEEDNMSDEQIQEYLNMLSEWMTTVEQSSPGGIFVYCR